MTRKRVFIDDCLIGEARTWGEVGELLEARGITFINGPRGAEGPSAFYLAAKPVEREATALRPAVA